MLKQTLPQPKTASQPLQHQPRAGERIERLTPGEQILRDIYGVIGGSGGFTSVDIDMTYAQSLIQAVRSQGVHATYTHVIIRATALALANHPEIHKLSVGAWRVHPNTVDVNLAVATGRIHPAGMQIKNAAHKSVREIATEVIGQTPIVRAQADQEFQRFQRIGRWIPIAPLQRLIIRYVQDRLAFRRACGVVSISCVPHVDLFVPFGSLSTAALGVGQVRERLTIYEGQECIRPMVTIACCFDHKVWHGLDPAILLTSMRSLLETPEALQ